MSMVEKEWFILAIPAPRVLRSRIQNQPEVISRLVPPVSSMEHAFCGAAGLRAELFFQLASAAGIVNWNIRLLNGG
jgi:hypothetical protein